MAMYPLGLIYIMNINRIPWPCHSSIWDSEHICVTTVLHIARHLLSLVEFLTHFTSCNAVYTDQTYQLDLHQEFEESAELVHHFNTTHYLYCTLFLL